MSIIFTGLVKERGFFQRRKLSGNNYSLVIEAEMILKDIKKGDSIAVNGVCLTVTDFNTRSFTADVMPETLRKTNLEDLKRGDVLNLEPALTMNDFLGGHLVSGHVDGTGEVKSVKPEDNARILEIEIKKELTDYIINKGSVCINGVSLTVLKVSENLFQVSLIPETWNSTNLKNVKNGDKLNIETDLVGKYIVETIKKTIQNSGKSMINEGKDSTIGISNTGELSKRFLQENGFA